MPLKQLNIRNGEGAAAIGNLTNPDDESATPIVAAGYFQYRARPLHRLRLRPPEGSPWVVQNPRLPPPAGQATGHPAAPVQGQGVFGAGVHQAAHSEGLLFRALAG